MHSRTSEPLWLSRTVVDAIHTDQVREHGGRVGVRDDNALESALARPRNKWSYDPDSDITSLAAAYAFAFARNHPYNDGNKRMALLVMLTFLSINGHEIEADDDDVLTTIIGLAAGRIGEGDLAAWLRAHLA